MRSTTLRLGMGMGLLALVMFGSPACSSDDDDSSGGKGGTGATGTGGSGATGGTAGSAGSSGSAGSGGSAGATPLTCGSETCTNGWTIGGVIQLSGCCAGAAQDTCGAQTDATVQGLFGFPPACYQTEAPGEVDCGCPTFTFKNPLDGTDGQFNGCCTPDGKCGYAIDISGVSGPNLGCQAADDLGGPGAGMTCTVGSETPPPASGDCPLPEGGTGDSGPGDAGADSST